MGISTGAPAAKTMNDREIHTPVMLDRVVELLAPAVAHDGAVIIDATLGMGGHTEAMLQAFPNARVIGIDRDTDAIEVARRRLADMSDRLTIVHAVYNEIARALREGSAKSADGILFDLGVSSMQLDRAERGFAYAKNAPLDMRMDRTEGPTAAMLIAEYPESALRRIFEKFGEEKLSARYARAIVRARETAPIETSAQLVEILIDATPAAVQRTGHPAKRVFQALRIEVNRELEAVELAIPAGLDALAVGGRMVVLSYQSLEDRIVKQEFATRSKSTAPAGLPIELPQHRPEFALLVRGAELADDAERARNPRSTPVRLRAAERIRAAA